MISGISKKLVFSYFLFINFIQPGKTVEFYKINESDNNPTSELSWSIITNHKIASNLSKQSFKNSDEFSADKNFLEKNAESLLADLNDKREELVIQSDKQSEINQVIYAEGNVSVSYKGKLLKADNLIYDKFNKKISANGNIALILGDQIFKVQQLEYSFISQKGYLLDVQGSINTKNLMDDLSSNFSFSDFNKIESLLELNKKEVLNTPGKVENWIFSADKMTIDGEKWKSKKAVFSNDLLELQQVKLVINSLEVLSEKEKLKFKSSLNYLIFEEKVSIPFWLGNRTFTKSKESLNLKMT